MTGGKFWKRIKRSRQLHWIILLPMAFIVFFNFVPMPGIALAWKRYIATKGIYGSPSVGWDNFKALFSYPMFWPAFWNTLSIACLKLAIGFPVPILTALLLNEVGSKAFKKTAQTLMYLPYFLSWVVLGGIIMSLFSLDGGINSLLQAVGFPPVFWLGKAGWFIFMLVFTEIWKNFGYGTIIYLAALTGIDKNLYEAAAIDGAGRWKQTLHITVPGVLPIAALMGILNLGTVLNAGFEQIFILNNALVAERATIIDTLVYDVTFADRNYGMATAMNLFKSVISFALILSGWFLANRYSDYRVF